MPQKKTNEAKTTAAKQGNANGGEQRLQRLLEAYEAGIIDKEELFQELFQRKVQLDSEASHQGETSSKHESVPVVKQAIKRVAYGDISGRAGIEQLELRGIVVPALLDKLIDAASADIITSPSYVCTWQGMKTIKTFVRMPAWKTEPILNSLLLASTS
jgi:hypothetical protein